MPAYNVYKLLDQEDDKEAWSFLTEVQADNMAAAINKSRDLYPDFSLRVAGEDVAVQFTPDADRLSEDKLKQLLKI